MLSIYLLTVVQQTYKVRFSDTLFKRFETSPLEHLFLKYIFKINYIYKKYVFKNLISVFYALIIKFDLVIYYTIQNVWKLLIRAFAI